MLALFLKEASKSVQVLLSGIEAGMVLTFDNCLLVSSA